MPSASDPHELREVRARIAAARELRGRAQACAREIVQNEWRHESYSHLEVTMRENRVANIILKFL